MNGVSLRFFDLKQIATCMDSELTMQSMQGDDHSSRVKHQAMAGSNIGDDHKEYFSGEQALKAAGKDNTMNQF